MSPIVKKNGLRHGVQLYKCMACGRQFRGGKKFSSSDVWELYLHNKQTISEISNLFHKSASTVKRRLREVKIEWRQPSLQGEGVVHIDATYFGRNTGVLPVLEAGTGSLLYMRHISHEHISDYEEAVAYIE